MKLLWLFLVFTPLAMAQDKTGVGAILGTPTGISVNHYLDQTHSIDGALDYRIAGKLRFHGSYLWHKPRSLKLLGQVTGWYYGAGARFRTVDNDGDDEIRLGARGSAGILWDFPKVRCDIFAEAALVLNVVPGTSGDGDIAIGARYYF